MSRWAWAEIDLDAIRHNVDGAARGRRPAAVWAVVKADGYGHGAVPVARPRWSAAPAGCASRWCRKGLALRAAGLDCPILVLSEQPAD